MITDLGSLELSVIVPSATVACNIAAPNAAAQITALASFTPQVTLSIEAQIASLEATLASLQAALVAVPPIPVLDLSAQVALALEVKDAIQAQLDILVAFQAALDEAGVRVLVYSGPQDDFGAELAAELGAPTTSINALVMLTSIPAAWAAMQVLFKTTA